MGKIISIELKNFKQHEHLLVDAQGRNVFLLGPNEGGKSSILDAIWFALNPDKENANTKIPVPLKQGATEGYVKIVTGRDGEQYTITRKFTEGSDERKISIVGTDGLKTAKVDMLDVVVGFKKIDPFEFVRWGDSAEGRRKQLTMIEGLLSDSVRDSLNKIRASIITAEQEFTKANNDKATNERSLQTLGVSEEDLLNYTEPTDVEAEMVKLNAAKDHNDALAKKSELKKSNEGKINANTTQITSRKQEIEQLQQEILELEAANRTMEDTNYGIDVYLQENEEKDTGPIEKAIKDATDHNTKCNMVVKYNETFDAVTASTTAVATAKKKVEDLRAERKAVIAKAKMPIKDLWFDEESIYLGELPLNDRQVSTSQIMKLAFAIALASGKKEKDLKLICIPRGESLDLNSIKQLKTFLADNPDWQAFVEEVDRGKEKLTVEYYETAKL